MSDKVLKQPADDQASADIAIKADWIKTELSMTVRRGALAIGIRPAVATPPSRPPPNRPPPLPPVSQALPPNPVQQAAPVNPDRERFGVEYMKLGDRLAHFAALESADGTVLERQLVLKGAMTALDKATDERRYTDALALLKTACGHADAVEEAHEKSGQAERDFYALYQPIEGRRQAAIDAQPPTEWTRKAKAGLMTADKVLQGHIDGSDWEQASKALPGVITALTAFDKAARQELESTLTILDGWAEAKAEAGGLRVDLGKLGEPLLADPGYPALANTIQDAMSGWRDVRTHANEMKKLATAFAPIATIPDATAAPALKPQWDAYDKAKAATPDPATITTTADHDTLVQMRDTYAVAGRALMKAYESGAGGAPPDVYWETLANDLSERTIVLFRQANKVPNATADIAKRKKEMNDICDAPFPDWQSRAAVLRQAEQMALQLVAGRTAQKDPAEIDLFARYAKARKSLEAALASIPDAGTTPAQQEYKTRYQAFLAKLNGADGDRVASCGAALDWLIPEALKLASAATQAVTDEIGQVTVNAATAGNDKTSTDAQALIDATKPELLAMLSTDAKLDLLDSLRKVAMPGFNSTDNSTKAASRNNPKRAAMRKLYHALALEEQFAKEDEANRKKLVDALRGKKQELKDAKENWSVMDDKQKLALLEMIATEQCKQYGFTMPANGIAIVNEPASNDNGSYSPSKLTVNPANDGAGSDTIKINGAKPVVHDFEAALDLILHENSHRHQNTLCRALRYPSGAPPYLTKDNTDPPYTQTRMFNMGNVPGGYVSGAEDYETYKKQPEEEHAWLAGPRGAQALMDMMASNEA